MEKLFDLMRFYSKLSKYYGIKYETIYTCKSEPITKLDR